MNNVPATSSSTLQTLAFTVQQPYLPRHTPCYRPSYPIFSGNTRYVCLDIEDLREWMIPPRYPPH